MSMEESISCPYCGHPGVPASGGGECPECGGKLPGPARFGAYQVIEKLGEGGMGTVYKGWDPGLRRFVAIKTLLPQLAGEQESRQRFLREAQSIASITHPHITQIFSIEEKDGIPFFAMEFVEGRPINDIVAERGPLPPREATDLLAQTARGLQEAHRKGIVHRDIKPANLLLTGDGTVKITDFGLAKEMKADSGLTSVGIVMGSPNYMSPEQGRGEAVDHRSDIYSLGVTFFEMVTGRLPFDAPTPMAMILKHTREPAPSPKRFVPTISYPLARTVQKMLAKRPDDRYQTYAGLLRDLDTADRLGKKPAAANGPQTAPSPERKPMGLPFFPLALGVLVVISAVLVYSQRVTGQPSGEPSPRPAAGKPPADPGAPPTEPVRRLGVLLNQAKDPAPGRPELVFTDSERSLLPDGGVRIFGSVQNKGNGAAHSIRVRIRALDERGETLDQSEVPLQPPDLPPGQTGFYEVLYTDLPLPPSSVDMELFWVLP